MCAVLVLATALAAAGDSAADEATLAHVRPARARWLAVQQVWEDPSDPARWTRLASTVDDPREALPLLEEALRLAPGEADAVMALARTLAAIGRTEEAVAVLQPLDSVEAKVALADVRRDVVPAREALAARPGDADAALAVARWTRDPGEARAALWSVTVPERRVLVARTELALRDGDLRSAQEELAAIRTATGDGPEVEMLARWVDCLEADTVDTTTLSSLLDARRAALTGPGQLSDLEPLVSRAPRCAAAQALLGALEPDLAARLRALQSAVALAPDDARLAQDLGEALLATGRPGAAFVQLERAARLSSSIPPTALARAAAALGDRDSAVRMLDDAALRFQDDTDFTLARAELTRDRGASLEILVAAFERTSDPRLLIPARELAEALGRADELAAVLRGPRPAPLPGDVSEEIVVIAQNSRDRLNALTDRIEALGYTRDPIRRGDGTVVFSAEGVNRPEITLHPDGTLDVQREGWVPVKQLPWLDKSPRVLAPISAQKLGQHRDRVIAALQPEVTAWRDALSSEALQERLIHELPLTFDAIWRDGVGRDGAPLPTPEARRAELLDWWVSRTCTPAGEAIRQSIAGYLHAVVQHSASPVTPSELDAINRRRPCEEPLMLPDADTR